MRKLTHTVYERFRSKVSILPGENACWNFIGARCERGYGRFWFQGRVISAHHFLIWPVPEGKFACHKCDNPQCVRPSHIFIGTQSENMLDCSAKGRLRSLIGQAAAAQKLRLLNVEQVREIRRLEGIYTQAELGKRYGVGQQTISRIINRRTYRHVA